MKNELKREEFRKRLYKMARDVTSKQISSLEGAATRETMFITFPADTIDYKKGEININAININSVVGNLETISFSIIPKSNDIIALRDLYISVKPEDIRVTSILDTISSANRTSGVGQIPVSS